MKISADVKHTINLFVYYLYNNTLLPGVDYLEDLMEIPSNTEMLFAVLTNNLEVDESGKVLNAEYSVNRATLFLKMITDDNGFDPVPPFEKWETDTHHYPKS